MNMHFHLIITIYLDINNKRKIAVFERLSHTRTSPTSFANRLHHIPPAGVLCECVFECLCVRVCVDVFLSVHFYVTVHGHARARVLVCL